MPLISLGQTLTGTVQDVHGRPLANVHCVLGEEATLNAQVINVTNQTYVPTLSLLRNLGIAEPGRNVRLRVVYAW